MEKNANSLTKRMKNPKKLSAWGDVLEGENYHRSAAIARKKTCTTHKVGTLIKGERKL